MARPTVYRFQVSEQDQGLRLDQLLARHVPELSRSKARTLLGLGGVFVDRRRVKVAGRQLRAGQRVEVHAGSVLARATGSATGQASGELEPAPEVRFSDEHIVVVDKPAGVLSAPTQESDGSNLQAFLVARFGRPIHVVHRLDRLTSGLLVFARSPAAAARLSEALGRRELGREYLLAVRGRVDFETREVVSPVRGKLASTTLWCVAREASVSLLRARLTTGRTHQIRVHAAAIGHPVLGDPVYGSEPMGAATARRPARLALHAVRLAFAHPETGVPLQFESPWPAELDAWWTDLSRRCAPRNAPAPVPGSES